MSSSEAQRSPVHQSTEDSSSEPTGPMAPASMNPPAQDRAGRAPDDTTVRNDSDESSFGGPLKIDDPDAGMPPRRNPGAPRGAGTTNDSQG